MTSAEYDTATPLRTALRQKETEKIDLEAAEASGFSGLKVVFQYESGTKEIIIDYTDDSVIADGLYARALSDLDDKIDELETALAAI